ncbi:MAG: flagellar basal body-associated FliL family protein, partial [Gammaproteobacteria bacterium]|nr:flagellar basal body-associated FliL family protein [Gammaproteobacteria bacterium]
MAELDDDLELDVENSKPAGSGKLKTILIFSAIGVLVIAISVAATWFILSSGDDSADGGDETVEATEVEDSAKKEKKNNKDKEKKKALSKAKVMYLDLAPAFVVNLESDSDVRYLQVEVTTMAHSAEDVELIKLHMPVIRHHLMLLFSSQEFSELRTTEGKEALQ